MSPTFAKIKDPRARRLLTLAATNAPMTYNERRSLAWARSVVIAPWTDLQPKHQKALDILRQDINSMPSSRDALLLDHAHVEPLSFYLKKLRPSWDTQRKYKITREELFDALVDISQRLRD